MSEIILTPIKKAVHSLEKALQQEKNEFTRDATIQRFEYTYELTWKLLKRFMHDYYGIQEGNIKNLYREALKHQLIEDLESWFGYHSARNLTSHTYNEKTAEETYQYAQPFLNDVKKLIDNIQDMLDAN